jgi:hypothetical protein
MRSAGGNALYEAALASTGVQYRMATAGVVGGFRVVGHSDILEAAVARRLRHPLQRLGAVGGVRVTVQDAACRSWSMTGALSRLSGECKMHLAAIGPP